jgi:hypothetical protein
MFHHVKEANIKRRKKSGTKKQTEEEYSGD